jgi:predicted NACHT family NTPase
LRQIEKMAGSVYQVEPPVGAIEYLLLNGRLLVIFDGLDELLDTSYRQQISANIESFSRSYPATPIPVTSREVGYDQVPLDPDFFEAFRLAPFDEPQVADYVEKWFRRDTGLSDGERAVKRESPQWQPPWGRLNRSRDGTRLRDHGH